MADQYEIAQRQRAALLRGDRAVSRVVLDAYFAAWKTIRADLEVVTRQLAEARARGEEPAAAWLFKEERLGVLQRQVEAEVTVIVRRLGPFLTGEQARWVARATEDAAALLGAAGGAAAGTVGGEFVRLNPGAVEGVIGFLSDGSPLQALLAELGPDAAKRVGDAVTQGVILGQSPAQIARASRRALGGSAARAMLISRDAVIRSYQETAHQNYLANEEVLAGWRWWATLDGRGRTCPSCVALHGTLHPLTERLREHPGGRCTQVPVVRGEPEPAFQTGPEWFAEQPADVQRTMVGPAKHGALTAGDIILEDLTVVRHSPRWGDHRAEATLGEALDHAEIRQREAAAAPPPPPANPGKALRFELRDIGEAYDQREQAARRKEAAAVDRFRAAHDALLTFSNSPEYLAAPYNDPTFEAEFQRLSALRDAANTKAQLAQVAHARVRNGRLKVMRDALIPAPVATPTQKLEVVIGRSRGGGDWTAEERQNIKAGAAFLAGVTQWGAAEGQLPYVRVREVPAGQAQRSYNQSGDVYLGAGAPRSRAHNRSVDTVVHELGHTLEYASLSVQEERRAFLRARTEGDPLVTMKSLFPNSTYKDTEFTRKDRFKEPYTGVDYSHLGGSIVPPNTGGHPRVSEVISMGVQHLYEDPEAFARDDPDFFDFIIGILRRP